MTSEKLLHIPNKELLQTLQTRVQLGELANEIDSDFKIPFLSASRASRWATLMADDTQYEKVNVGHSRVLRLCRRHGPEMAELLFGQLRIEPGNRSGKTDVGIDREVLSPVVAEYLSWLYTDNPNSATLYPTSQTEYLEPFSPEMHGHYLPPNHSYSRAQPGYHEIGIYDYADLSYLEQQASQLKQADYGTDSGKQLGIAYAEKLRALLVTPERLKNILYEKTKREEERHRWHEIAYRVASINRASISAEYSLYGLKAEQKDKDILTKMSSYLRTFGELEAKISADFEKVDEAVYVEAAKLLELFTPAGGYATWLNKIYDEISQRQERYDFPSLSSYLILFTADLDIIEKVRRGEISRRDFAQLLEDNLRLVLEDPTTFAGKYSKGLKREVSRRLVSYAFELLSIVDTSVGKYHLDTSELLYWKNYHL